MESGFSPHFDKMICGVKYVDMGVVWPIAGITLLIYGCHLF
jgi:hypothetical protein